MTQLELSTRFTKRFGLGLPIACAPMAGVTGGALASAVSRAGALGFVGGGYGDAEWTRRELGQSDVHAVGCGFVTWAIEADPSAFDVALEMAPRAIFLSFGSPRKFAQRARDRGIPVFCQVQLMEQLREVIDAGATVIVAQGTEAGGHGMSRRTVMTLVPEVRDWLDRHSPETLLLAAGGIADGRGLAAALTLGADGAVIGTRFWASRESLAPDGAKAAALALDGDSTSRSRIFDILRRKNWPPEYDFRAHRNEMHRRWEGQEQELRQAPDAAREEFEVAAGRGDFMIAHLTVGEGVGLVRSIPRASELVADIATQALGTLARLNSAGNASHVV